MTEQTEPIEEFTDSTPDSTEEVYDAADSAENSDDYIEVSSGEELWDELDLGAFLTEPSDEESEETDDAEVDDASYDDTAFPSDDEVADAEEMQAEQEDEEIDEAELLAFDLDRPAPLSRRKAERVVKGIIEPLRDPNTPISEVLGALAEFHPTRTQQLAEAIVNESVAAYPDEWLRTLTGMDVSLDQIKEWAAMGGRQPSNPAPAQTDSGELQTVIAELNDLYGDAWRNPQFDDDLIDADVPLVKAVRAQMAQTDAYTNLQQELQYTKSQLEQLQPQIENIKSAQEAEIEQVFVQTLTAEVQEYRKKVESNAIPKVLEAKGLAPRDSDSEEVAAAKQMLYNRFIDPDGNGSEFDVFIDRDFSGKEQMGKAIQRVGSYLTQAARLEADARRAVSQQDAYVLKTKAAALKEQAMHEQDALTVWTRKATAEYLQSSHVTPLLNLLQHNADLQRRLNMSGRPEIVGQTTAIGGAPGLRSAIQQAKEQGVNPFDLDISSLLGGR